MHYRSWETALWKAGRLNSQNGRMNRNIGIFCASSNRMAPVFYDEAQRLGEWIGSQGRTLVYGGAKCGLMETLAKSVHEAGGRVLGVVPQILVEQGRVSRYIDETVLTPDLNQRKQGIIDRSDIILALPGSVGTLDEVFTVLAANTIGIHSKRVLFWNIDGFWDELFRLFRAMEKRGVVNKPLEDYILVANTLDEVVRLIG